MNVLAVSLSVSLAHVYMTQHAKGDLKQTFQKAKETLKCPNRMFNEANNIALVRSLRRTLFRSLTDDDAEGHDDDNAGLDEDSRECSKGFPDEEVYISSCKHFKLENRNGLVNVPIVEGLVEESGSENVPDQDEGQGRNGIRSHPVSVYCSGSLIV